MSRRSSAKPDRIEIKRGSEPLNLSTVRNIQRKRGLHPLAYSMATSTREECLVKLKCFLLKNSRHEEMKKRRKTGTTQPTKHTKRHENKKRYRFSVPKIFHNVWYFLPQRRRGAENSRFLFRFSSASLRLCGKKRLGTEDTGFRLFFLSIFFVVLRVFRGQLEQAYSRLSWRRRSDMTAPAFAWIRRSQSLSYGVVERLRMARNAPCCLA